jgi:tetratricopeptide (TPR) repeat protein
MDNQSHDPDDPNKGDVPDFQKPGLTESKRRKPVNISDYISALPGAEKTSTPELEPATPQQAKIGSIGDFAKTQNDTSATELSNSGAAQAPKNPVVNLTSAPQPDATPARQPHMTSIGDFAKKQNEPKTPQTPNVDPNLSKPQTPPKQQPATPLKTLGPGGGIKRREIRFPKLRPLLQKVPAGFVFVGILVTWVLWHNAHAVYVPPGVKESIQSGIDAAQKADWNKAISYFDAARRADPNSPQILYDLAKCEAQIPGRELRAICWLKAFLVLAPDSDMSPKAEIMIAQLELQSEARAENLVEKLSQMAALFPANSDEGIQARDKILEIMNKLEQDEPDVSSRPIVQIISSPPTVQVGRQLVCSIISRYLDEKLNSGLYLGFDAELPYVTNIPKDANNKTWSAFTNLSAQTGEWADRLNEIRENSFD